MGIRHLSHHRQDLPSFRSFVGPYQLGDIAPGIAAPSGVLCPSLWDVYCLLAVLRIPRNQFAPALHQFTFLTRSPCWGDYFLQTLRNGKTSGTWQGLLAFR